MELRSWLKSIFSRRAAASRETSSSVPAASFSGASTRISAETVEGNCQGELSRETVKANGWRKFVYTADWRWMAYQPGALTTVPDILTVVLGDDVLESPLLHFYVFKSRPAEPWLAFEGGPIVGELQKLLGARALEKFGTAETNLRYELAITRADLEMASANVIQAARRVTVELEGQRIF